MPRVLLIRPLCEGDEPEFAEPLGIERLAGYLRAHGVRDVVVLDRRLYWQEHNAGLATGRFWDDARALCGNEGPAMVGVSLMTASDVPDGLRILSRARALWPQVRLVAGGLYVTTASQGVAARFPHDVTLLRGEGEEALLALAQGRSASGCVEIAPDAWACAYRPHVDRYARLGCAVNMQTSRGCPGTCTFCATPSLPHGLRRWRPRSVQLVVDEMEHEAARLDSAGLLPIFNFVDDDFGPLARIEELSAELERRRLRVAFALEMRMASLMGQDNLSQRLARMHETGLTRVFVGVESLNPQTLRSWHKPYDTKALPRVLDAFASAGIAMQPGYILWHRDQTVAGARDEVACLRDLGIYSHRAALSRLIVFEGCALAHEGETGFQPMHDAEEGFYQWFAESTTDLLATWTHAAIAEPYAAAEAFLTGDDTRLQELRETLSLVNERSFELFMRGDS